MKKIYLIVICCCISIVSSCSRDQNEDIDQNLSLIQVFDQFYQFMDEHYVFWDLDATDWEKMYDVRTQFQDLNITVQQDRLTAVALFREMTKDILDHHFTIDFTANGIRGLQINPALDRKNLDQIPSYFDTLEEVESAIQGAKYDGQYLDGTPFLTGFVNDSTVIFKASFFNFQRSYGSGISPESDQALNWFFEAVENDDTKKIILDLRSCLGGDLVDLNFFFGKLIREDITFGYTKFKMGRARTNYTPLIPALVRSRRLNKNFAPKITVLTNTMTASLAEIMAYIIQSNNLGSIIGSTTYGATSPIASFQLFNSGILSIGEFMRVRTASVQLLDRDKRSMEGEGVIPD